jgi:hypothetical protein
VSVIFYYERLSISFDKKRCPAVYTTASLTAFTGRALMTFQRETGYVEGGNLTIEFRWTEGRNERLPGMTAEPVLWQASVIFAPRSTPAALATRVARYFE